MATAKFIAVTGTQAAEALLREIGGPMYKRVVYGGLDDTAKHAQRNMAEVFEREIEGGPARFTRIVPGQRSSSVLVREARKVGNQIESGLNVNRLQSAYLKYMLGDAIDRRPGDVGSAKSYNFIPMVGAREAGGFSLATDGTGNLGKQALKKLTRAAQSQREKDKAKLKKTLKRDATADEFDQFRKDRQAGRKRKRRIDARVGKRSTIFFRPLGPETVGYFERTNGSPRLLVMGVKLSQYDRPYLRPSWDRTVAEAGQRAPLFMQERLRREFARMG